MLLIRTLLGLLASLASVSAAVAQGITVSPMQLEMVSSGTRNRSSVTVVNGSSQPMPVEAVVQRMTLDENGKAHTSKAGDEFLVMPPQAMIPAGATQNFRIQWLGDPVVDQSQSFFVFFNQVPVKSPEGRAALQVVMSMGVMVNVAPPQGAPGLQLVSTGILSDKSGKRHPTITVANPTKVHALLPQATVQLSSGGWSQTLPPNLLSERVGIGLVQPGRQRKFVLPIDLPSSVQAVQASLTMTPKRQ